MTIQSVYLSVHLQSWSSDTQILWACGRTLQQVNPAQISQSASEDISLKMKRRAKRGYGIQVRYQSYIFTVRVTSVKENQGISDPRFQIRKNGPFW